MVVDGPDVPEHGRGSTTKRQPFTRNQRVGGYERYLESGYDPGADIALADVDDNHAQGKAETLRAERIGSAGIAAAAFADIDLADFAHHHAAGNGAHQVGDQSLDQQALAIFKTQLLGPAIDIAITASGIVMQQCGFESIQRQGDDRILIQVPGIGSASELKDLIGTTARLTFHPVVSRTSDADAVPGGRNVIYPSMEEELKMLGMLQHGHPVNSLKPVITAEELVACQQEVRQVYVDPKIQEYLMQIVHDTRESEELSLGASPRASIALFRTSQAMAAIRGRNFVQPDDVKRVAAAVLTHRVILKPESRLRKVTAEYVISEVIAEIAVPTLTNE